jgi:hypothetical protein
MVLRGLRPKCSPSGRQMARKEGQMETPKNREHLTDEEKERFEGYAAAIFSR